MQVQRAGVATRDRVPAPGSAETARWILTPDDYDSSLYRRAADRILSGQMQVFDATTEGELDWNRDPSTGIRSPMTFGPAIDLRSAAVVGNIRYLWELNRHHGLVTLAQAFELTGDGKYLAGARAYLSTWFEQCPYLKGPNWTSGLELAVRLINWSVAWQLIGARQEILLRDSDGRKFKDAWLRSIYQHAHFVQGHYSRYSSANNHLIGEAAGVFVAACTWPLWKEFFRWRAAAFDILCAEIDRQVAGDGVDREQTTAYQRFVAELSILALLAGRASGISFPKPFHDRIKKMLAFLADIMDVEGHVPMIGDSDDAAVTRLSPAPNFDACRSLLATGALLFEEGHLARAAGALDDKTRWLVPADRWDEIAASHGGVTGEDPASPSFPEGGYYLLGTDLGSPKEIRLIVDAGPLGYLSIAAHGHADALAVYLSVAGREFFIDPGTYIYQGDEAWRRYFRGTRAHNTVSIDSQDQSMQAGPFMWTRHFRAKCTAYDRRPGRDHFEGRHDGYERLDDPVTHKRRIVRRGNVFQVKDDILAHRTHTVERCWHFSESCTVSIDGSDIVAENSGVRIRLRDLEPDTRIVHLRGSEDPIGGWVSRRFGFKTPASSVYFRNRTDGNRVLRTEIECFHER